MNKMSYSDAIKFIRAEEAPACIPGLARVTDLLHRLGDPQKKLRCIHIAGTNGKGSVAAMLASVLQEAGYCTGLFTSPYLVRHNEQICVNGRQIPDEGLCETASAVKEAVLSMQEIPSGFERLVPMAFLWFVRCSCDIVVIETGMGGRLDATNVFEVPEAVVLTHIALDHTEYLGETIAEIAREKAGIIKENADVILMCQKQSQKDNADPYRFVLPDSEKSVLTDRSISSDVERSAPVDEAAEVIRQCCQDQHAALHVTDPDAFILHAETTDGQSFRYRGSCEYEMHLAGSCQRSNVMTVLDTVDVLRGKGWTIPASAVKRGLLQVQWPARFERIHSRPAVILDGAHNADGVRELVRSLESLLEKQDMKKSEHAILFVMGVLADKDYTEMLALTAPLAKGYITTEPGNARALSAELLCRIIREKTEVPAVCGGSIQNSLRLALEQSRETDVICVFGSLYQAGEVRAYFESEQSFIEAGNEAASINSGREQA